MCSIQFSISGLEATNSILLFLSPDLKDGKITVARYTFWKDDNSAKYFWSTSKDISENPCMSTMLLSEQVSRLTCILKLCMNAQWRKKHSSYYKKTVVLHKNCSETHSESKMKKNTTIYLPNVQRQRLSDVLKNSALAK